MKARGTVAFVVALVAALAVGLWFGGHPGHLPNFLRERFVAEPAGLTGEAAELIQDNYFRSVGDTELENSSLQGMVHELRKRHGDRFSDYFSPESLESFNQQIEGRRSNAACG
jgi:C-terminal processing protease CtpA/Prc